MRYIDKYELERLPGIRIGERESFTFRCYPGIACFNRCCYNLNLFLYPYDVVRLKKRLGISSDQFIERYVDIVLRNVSFFPEVLLRMSDENEGVCPFVAPSGCSIYRDRPDTCRKFPMEQGVLYDAKAKKTSRVYFFNPPDFCLGPRESTTWTPLDWASDPDDVVYDNLTLEWAKLKKLFQNNPWGREGSDGPKARMSFMAIYNVDRFREFVFQSSFLKRYTVKPALLKKLKKDDVKLLRLAFEWVKYYLWGIKSKSFRPKGRI